MNVTTKLLSIILASSVISGCGIGQKKVLFTTRSNVGLDVDAKQFTAQINIDRQEAVIGPTFEGGKHIPIAAAFRNDNRLLGGFGVSSLFAGGDAAIALTTKSNPNRKSGESLITLTQAPIYKRGIIGQIFDSINPFITETEINKNEKLPGPSEVKPFIFDTDTSLGIKLAWTGATGEFPDKVKIGFNREEFALAPVMATQYTTDEQRLQAQKVIVDTLSGLLQETSEKFDNVKKQTLLFEQNKIELAQQLQEAEQNLKSNSSDNKLQTEIQKIKTGINSTNEKLEKSKIALSFLDEQTKKLDEQLVNAKKNAYQVGVPSFFAALDNYSEFKSIKNSNIGFRQVFAAGQSATNLADNPALKSLMKERFGLNEAGTCLVNWLRTNSSARAALLDGWFKNNDFSVKTVKDLINNPYAWQNFAAKNIEPGGCVVE